MTFFDSSTPVPIGQETPSVKAPVGPYVLMARPDGLSEYGDRTHFSENTNLVEYTDLAEVQGLAIQHSCYIFSRATNGAVPTCDCYNCGPVVVQWQDDRGNHGLCPTCSSILVKDGALIKPELSPEEAEREAIRLELAKVASTPVPNGQDSPSVKAPELLTQDEIEQIYRLISHELPRSEYDRLIDKVIDLNNYAKGEFKARMNKDLEWAKGLTMKYAKEYQYGLECHYRGIAKGLLIGLGHDHLEADEIIAKWQREAVGL